MYNVVYVSGYNSVIQLRIYIYLFFFRFFSHVGFFKIVTEFPVAYSRFLLIIYFLCGSTNLSLPSPLPFGNHVCILYLWACFCFE